MRQNLQFHRLLFLTTCLFVICLGGCNPSAPASSDKDSEADLPKLSFHQPENFSMAVTRLNEIMGVIESKEALPSPRKFKVREVVHGTGSSAHSHFYLADSKEQVDHGHADQESSEKLHDYEVDLITELVDVVRWLPKIAGDGDMDRNDWDQVNKSSSAISQILEKATSGSSETETLDSIRSESQTIKKHLEQLGVLAKSNTEDSE